MNGMIYVVTISGLVQLSRSCLEEPERSTYQQKERPQVDQLETLKSHLLSFEQFSPTIWLLNPLVARCSIFWHSEGLEEAKRGKQFLLPPLRSPHHAQQTGKQKKNATTEQHTTQQNTRRWNHSSLVLQLKWYVLERCKS
jgi:hypothetical protein